MLLWASYLRHLARLYIFDCRTFPFLLLPPSSSSPSRHSSLRLCVPHGGSICNEFFSGKFVLYNTTDYTLESEVREMVISLQTLHINPLPIGTLSMGTVERCVHIAMEVLCLSAYPFCTQNPLITQPICRRTCDLFKDKGACEGVVTPENFTKAYELMTSRCDEEPFPGGNSPECVQVQFDDSAAPGE